MCVWRNSGRVSGLVRAGLEKGSGVGSIWQRTGKPCSKGGGVILAGTGQEAFGKHRTLNYDRSVTD